MTTTHEEDYSVPRGPDLAALEEQIRTAPERPMIHRLVANRQSDAELAAAFKARMLANLVEQAVILDEMKASGPFACNWTWAVDVAGHHTVATITMTRVYT